MDNVEWEANDIAPARIYFEDLDLQEGFRIKGRDAIYIKVEINSLLKSDDTEAMMEVATGKVFKATKSTVERVAVKFKVAAPKPKIYA